MVAKRTWTAKRRAAVEEWLSSVLPIMRLADWTITVDWEGREETHPAAGEHPSALASINQQGNSRHAEISLSRELLDLSPAARRQALVHELCHCYFFSVHSTATELFEAAVKEKTARRLYSTAVNQQVELATDHLADALYPLLPDLDLS